MVSNIKKKSYNPLEHRKKDFDVDYEEFKAQVKELDVRPLRDDLLAMVSLNTFLCVHRLNCRHTWSSSLRMPRQHEGPSNSPSDLKGAIRAETLGVMCMLLPL